MKRRLESANLEIARLSKDTRRHAIIQANYYRIKTLWEEKETLEVVDCDTQFPTWTVPEIKEAKFIRMINMQLRARNKIMKKQIEDLKAQLIQLKEPSK